MHYLILAGVLMLSLWQPVHAATIATFSDPVAVPSPFLFTYTDTTNNGVVDGTMTGGFSGTGLNLIFPFQAFAPHLDTTFTITDMLASPVAGDPNGIRFVPVGGSGLVTFTQGATDILEISFNEVHRTLGGVGATDTLAGEAVDIFIPGVSPDLIIDPETFFFSFANVRGNVAAALAGNASVIESTAALTSSAELATVPEPASLFLMGLGVLMLAVWRVLKRWGWHPAGPML